MVDAMAVKRACTLKIKLFTSLWMKNKILIWEVLRGRGFYGTGRYSLCFVKTDLVSHLFGDCVFFLEIWTLLMNYFKLKHNREGALVKDNLQVWYTRKDHSIIPVFVMWEVWKARNASIFSNFL